MRKKEALKVVSRQSYCGLCMGHVEVQFLFDHMYSISDVHSSVYIHVPDDESNVTALRPKRRDTLMSNGNTILYIELYMHKYVCNMHHNRNMYMS